MGNKTLVAKNTITRIVSKKRTTIAPGEEFTCNADEADSLIDSGAATLKGASEKAEQESKKDDKKSEGKASDDNKSEDNNSENNKSENGDKK